jgi:uncharacterized membrane protein
MRVLYKKILHCKGFKGGYIFTRFYVTMPRHCPKTAMLQGGKAYVCSLFSTQPNCTKGLNSMNKTLNTLIASAVALTIAGAAGGAMAMDGHDAPEGKEKCYGVAKAAANDCANAAGTHSCAGQAVADADGGEWIALPAGTCAKIVGGSVEPIAAVDPAAEPEAVEDLGATPTEGAE